MNEPIVVPEEKIRDYRNERVQMWLRGQISSDLLEEFLRGD